MLGLPLSLTNKYNLKKRVCGNNLKSIGNKMQYSHEEMRDFECVLPLVLISLPSLKAHVVKHQMNTGFAISSENF